MTTEQIEEIINKKVDKIDVIHKKDGIILNRAFCGKVPYIVKEFEKLEFAREIEFYKLFKSLRVPTIKVIAQTQNCIILQDLSNSKTCHLATKSDLKNEETIKSLAKWYKKLHNCGKKIDKSDFYCEYDLVTSDNLKKLHKVLNKQSYKLLQNNISKLTKIKDSLNYTITYNDFALENMAICNQKAIMFDYNLVGKGTVYADVINVCSMLDKNMQQVFFAEYYGKKSMPKKEMLAHYFLGTLSSLIIGYNKDNLPNWVLSLIKKVNSEEFVKKLKNLNVLKF